MVSGPTQPAHTAHAAFFADETAGKTCRIRPARADEAELLTDLSLRSKALWGYDAAFLARCRAIMQVKTGNIESQPHFVAEIEGRIVGFGGFEPEAEGIGLDYLFIENEFIGRGIGRALWDHAVAAARRLGHAAMIVVSDPHAEGFYLRMGCRRIGTRTSELENGRQLPLLRYDL